jgi:hypothetical protein
LFELVHLAAIRFVVVTGEVQHAVEDENFHFREQVMANPGGLGSRRLDGDRNVSALGRVGAGEREHVGGLIHVAELQIEALHFSVAGEQDVDLAGEPGSALSLIRKSCECQAAQVLRFSSF